MSRDSLPGACGTSTYSRNGGRPRYDPCHGPSQAGGRVPSWAHCALLAKSRQFRISMGPSSSGVFFAGTERPPSHHQLASIPQFPASVPPLAFLDEQKDAIGEYFTENWERCKAGFSGVWRDWNYAREIEQRNRNGEAVTFSEKCHLIRNRQDVGKVFRALFVYAVGPSVFPYYLIFWPGCLPSTFDLEKHKKNKQLESIDNRVRGVLMSLIELEKSCLNFKDKKLAEQSQEVKKTTKMAVQASSPKAALEVIQPWLLYNASALKPKQERKPDLSDMPEPMVRGAAIGSNSAFPWLPGFILKFGLKSYLERVVEVDKELSNLNSDGFATMPLSDLQWVAFERGIGDLSWSSAQLQSGITKYLKTCDDANVFAAPGKCHPDMALDPFRLRLAVIGIQAVTTARYSAGNDLTRSLYQGPAATKGMKLGY